MVISDIGSTNADALICHTDRPDPNGNPNPEGDWFAPDGGMTISGFRTNGGPKVLRLLRATDSGPPAQGIYHCVIEAKIGQNPFQNVHIGLYTSGEGMYQSNYVYTHPAMILLQAMSLSLVV